MNFVAIFFAFAFFALSLVNFGSSQKPKSYQTDVFPEPKFNCKHANLDYPQLLTLVQRYKAELMSNFKSDHVMIFDRVRSVMYCQYKKEGYGYNLTLIIEESHCLANDPTCDPSIDSPEDKYMTCYPVLMPFNFYFKLEDCSPIKPLPCCGIC